LAGLLRFAADFDLTGTYHTTPYRICIIYISELSRCVDGNTVLNR
jgi:hypothetical protein